MQARWIPSVPPPRWQRSSSATIRLVPSARCVASAWPCWRNNAQRKLPPSSLAPWRCHAARRACSTTNRRPLPSRWLRPTNSLACTRKPNASSNMPTVVPRCISAPTTCACCQRSTASAGGTRNPRARRKRDCSTVAPSHWPRSRRSPRCPARCVRSLGWHEPISWSTGTVRKSRKAWTLALRVSVSALLTPPCRNPATCTTSTHRLNARYNLPSKLPTAHSMPACKKRL